MAAPTLRDITTVGTNSTSTIVFTAPAGVTTGDLILVAFDLADPAATVTVPTGFTLVKDQLFNLNNKHAFVYQKDAGASEPSTYSFTASAGNIIRGFCAAYQSSGGGVAIDVSSKNSGTGTSITATGVTTGYANETIVFIGGFSITSSTPNIITPPSGMTERSESTPQHAEWADVAFVGPGATGNKSASSSPTSAAWAAFLIALRGFNSGAVAMGGTSSLTAVGLKDTEAAAILGPGASDLAGDATYAAAGEAALGGGHSRLVATATGIPALDFTVYDSYIDDGTNAVGYILHDTEQTRAGDQSLRLQPVRQDVGNNPAEIRPESGDLFAQSDFSHGDGQEYFHHTGRDPRRFLHSEGFDIAVPGKLTHLHEMLSATPGGALGMGDIAVADGLPFYVDGDDLYVGDGTFPGVWTLEDWDVTESP